MDVASSGLVVPSLSQFEYCRNGLADFLKFLRRESLEPGLESVFGNGTDLVDHCHGGVALACDRNGYWGMGLGGQRQRDYDHRPTKPIQRVVRQHNTRSCLIDFRTLCWVEADPPDITPLDGCISHSSIPSSNDCHSSISRASALSRFAARQAEASESSRSANSCCRRRVTRRDR